MASNPPGLCCTVGVKHEGKATGTLKDVAGYQTYIATPEKPHPGVGVLICTDVIGHGFVNVQLIADQLAANGYTVYMPDIFYGDPVPLDNKPPGFDLQKWIKGTLPGKGEGKGHGPDTVEPVVTAVSEAMKDAGCDKIGMVGYCFGAKYAIRALGDGRASVVYVAHPSFVDESEVEAIKGPLSIAAAETDSIFPTEKRHRTEEILPKTKQPWQINLYSGVEHGFAVRGNPNDLQNKLGKESAFLQMVNWFDYFLKP